MPADPTPSSLFNPIALWTDASMAALDQALASSQDLGDGVDRMARAGAAAEPATAAPMASKPGSAAPSNLGLGLALHLQQAVFELVSQAWQQWFSALGTLATLGAGGSFKEAERQNPWLNMLRQTVAGEASAASGTPGTPRRQAARGGEPAGQEHAYAEEARGRRSRPKAKAGGRGRARAKG